MHSGEQVQSTYCTQSPKYRHPDSVNRAPVTTDRLVPQKTSILQKKPTVDFAKQAKLWRKRARVEPVFLHRNPCLPGVQLCIVVCGLASSLTVLFAVRKKNAAVLLGLFKKYKIDGQQAKKKEKRKKTVVKARTEWAYEFPSLRETVAQVNICQEATKCYKMTFLWRIPSLGEWQPQFLSFNNCGKRNILIHRKPQQKKWIMIIRRVEMLQCIILQNVRSLHSDCKLQSVQTWYLQRSIWIRHT